MLKEPSDRRSSTRWRLYVVLTLCSILPLLLFLYAADRLLRRNFTKSVLQQSRQAATMTGELLEDRLTKVKDALEAMARNPVTRDAWTRGDLRTLSHQLEQSYTARRDSGFVGIYDGDGRLRVIFPQLNPGDSANLTSPPWLAAATQQHGAYISGLSAASISTIHQTIVVAVPLENPSGFLVGIYGLDAVKAWLRGVPETTTKWVSIVDQNGNLVFAPGLSDAGPVHNLSDQAEVKKVLAGQNGSEVVPSGGQQSVVSRYPVRSCGWGLLVQVPFEEINKVVWQGEQPIALLGLIFLVLAAIVGIVVAGLHRKRRESEQHIRQIISSSADAFVAIDAQGNITDLNPQAEVLFGWPKAEVLGRPLHLTFIPPRYREAHLQGMERFRTTRQGVSLNKQLELSALHRDGHEFPVELSISHLRKDRKDYFSSFVRDISERKRAEQEVKDLNAELQVRISQLEARNKELEAFSYSVSHDVRAPLRHILGFSRILAQECGPQMTAEGKSYLEQIQHSSMRVQRLVDDLLRFSRVGEQGLNRQKTRLGDLVAEVISGLRRDLDGRDVNFQVSSLPVVECDRSLVTQVFWNLLSNAVKFTATRPRAVISVGQSRQGDQDVLFVSDNGVGFDMKHAEKLFQAFQRLHGDEFEGSGVGLATVERIVLKHKGRIWAKSEIGVGATFFFTLGAGEAVSPTPLPPEQSRAAVSGPIGAI